MSVSCFSNNSLAGVDPGLPLQDKFRPWGWGGASGHLPGLSDITVSKDFRFSVLFFFIRLYSGSVDLGVGRIIKK